MYEDIVLRTHMVSSYNGVQMSKFVFKYSFHFNAL